MTLDQQKCFAQEWIRLNLVSKPNLNEKISDIYSAYETGIILEQGIVPLKRKTFISLLKTYFELDISQSKIVFFYKGEPWVQGLGLVEKYSSSIGNSLRAVNKENYINKN